MHTSRRPSVLPETADITGRETLRHALQATPNSFETASSSGRGNAVKTLFTTGLVVVVGVLAGFTGAIVAQRSYAAQPVTNKDPATRSLPSLVQRQQPADDSCRSDESAGLPARPTTSATPLLESAQQHAPLMDPEEQLKVESQEQSKRLTAHDQEPRDATWAKQMESTLLGAFEELSHTSNFHYSHVDCRYVSCSAKVTWSNGDDARTDLPKLAMLHDGLPCTRFVVLDRIPAGNTAITGTAVFDCQHARLDGARLDGTAQGPK